jgi:hypothetical protein
MLKQSLRKTRVSGQALERCAVILSKILLI